MLRGMAHFISLYKLNKAENQDDKSKMIQILYLNLKYINIIELGLKFMLPKLHQDHLQIKKVKKLRVRKLVILVNEEDRIWPLFGEGRRVGRSTNTTGNFSLF